MSQSTASKVPHVIHFKGSSAYIEVLLPADNSYPDGSVMNCLAKKFEAHDHLEVDTERTGSRVLNLLKDMGVWAAGQRPDKAEFK